MKSKSKAHVSKKKIESVKELEKLIKNNRTVLVASIKNIPASQFQEIGKKLRGKAIVKVPKKSLIYRALEESDEKAKELKKAIKEDVAILFSNLDSFDLANELVKNKTSAKAKAGQEAPEDIEIEAGPTDLLPGPAISELGALGIEIQIEKGKISIKSPKVIVKKGGIISRQAADLMGKLDIKPFSVGFVPLCALDTKEKKIYSNININTEETIKKLKEAHGRALPFAVSIGYPTKETIKHLIAKGYSHAKALEKLKHLESKKEENTPQENSGEEK